MLGIAEVHVRTWQAAYRGLVPGEYLDSLPVDRRELVWVEILQHADLPSSGVFVIEDDDRIIAGFGAITPSRDADSTPTTGEVGAIYLLPEFWLRVGALESCGRESARSRVLDSDSLGARRQPAGTEVLPRGGLGSRWRSKGRGSGHLLLA